MQSPLLLISYPVSYIWALTSFRASHFRKALEAQVTSLEQKILVVYGDKDQFTTQKAYSQWTSRLKSCVASEIHHAERLSIIELSDTDHFWADKLSELCQLVGAWVENLSVM